MTQLGLVPDRTTIDNPAGCAAWVIKLDSTEDQLRDAVAQIGDWAADVEMHLTHGGSQHDQLRRHRVCAV